MAKAKVYANGKRFYRNDNGNAKGKRFYRNGNAKGTLS